MKKLLLKSKKEKKTTIKWGILASAAIVAAAAAAFAVLTQPRAVLAEGKIAEPSYPEGENTSAAPDSAFLEGIQKFSVRSASRILKETEGENRLYSPISLAMALSMMAQTSDGATRSETLELLGADSIDRLRSQTGSLFRFLYEDGENDTLKLANSIWLNQELAFHRDTLDLLAKDYYASSYSVDFAAADTPKQISQWISENTGGLLGGENSDFVIPERPLALLFNTIYFRSQWNTSFGDYLTKEDTFTKSSGETVTCPFMQTAYSGCDFTVGDGYSRVSSYFTSGCRMNFILPEEGSSPEAILGEEALLAKALYESGDAVTHRGEVTLRVPKFDFHTSLDLKENLKALGIVSAFSDSADFSPLSGTPASVSDVIQEAKISVDERGCEAAAYTEIAINATGALLPEGEKFEMVLNRPFLFAIEGPAAEEGQPRPLLFIGVVNNPK